MDCYNTSYSSSFDTQSDTYAKDDTVIIFDWDDTLCPSSFIDQKKVESFNDLPLHFQNLFNEISRCAEQVLESASNYGEVLIITNSDEGWVKYSCAKYLPDLLPVLDNYKIVSARTQYESFYPSQPLCWKSAAFAHEVNEFFSRPQTRKPTVSFDDKASLISETSVETSRSSDSMDDIIPILNEKHMPRQVISYGDSMEERTAVKIVASQLGAIPKSVMFVSGPSPCQIIGELAMLSSHMTYVCTNEDPLDLEISRSQASRTAEKYFRCKQGTNNILMERKMYV